MNKKILNIIYHQIEIKSNIKIKFLKTYLKIKIQSKYIKCTHRNMKFNTGIIKSIYFIKICK